MQIYNAEPKNIFKIIEQIYNDYRSKIVNFTENLLIFYKIYHPN